MNISLFLLWIVCAIGPLYAMQYYDEDAFWAVEINQVRCHACNNMMPISKKRSLMCGHNCCMECFYYQPTLWCRVCKESQPNSHYDPEAWQRYLLNTHEP